MAGWKSGCSCRWPTYHKDLAYSAYLLKHPPRARLTCCTNRRNCRVRPISIATCENGPASAATQTARGGQNVEVNAGGSHYMISLSYTSNTLATNVAEGTNGQLGNTSTTDSAALVSQAAATLPAADRHGSSLRDAGQAESESSSTARPRTPS